MRDHPIAIDPPGCGCTECIVGEYVPLDEATSRQIGLMLQGRIANNTGLEFTVNVLVKAVEPYALEERSWELTPSEINKGEIL